MSLIDIVPNHREEYEASHNHLEVRIHLASSYRLRNGALQPVDSEPNAGSTALVFDRRKTVGDLRLAIYEVLSHKRHLN